MLADTRERFAALLPQLKCICTCKLTEWEDRVGPFNQLETTRPEEV